VNGVLGGSQAMDECIYDCDLNDSIDSATKRLPGDCCCTSLACCACQCGEGSSTAGLCAARPLAAKAPGANTAPTLPTSLYASTAHLTSAPIASRTPTPQLAAARPSRKAHLLAGQLRSFPASALYHRLRTSLPPRPVAPYRTARRYTRRRALISPARRLFFFYDTPSYAHDARHDGCCALRDPDRRRWQV
jgi:hypothetical protein